MDWSDTLTVTSHAVVLMTILIPDAAAACNVLNRSSFWLDGPASFLAAFRPTEFLFRWDRDELAPFLERPPSLRNGINWENVNWEYQSLSLSLSTIAISLFGSDREPGATLCILLLGGITRVIG